MAAMAVATAAAAAAAAAIVLLHLGGVVTADPVDRNARSAANVVTALLLTAISRG